MNVNVMMQYVTYGLALIGEFPQQKDIRNNP